MTWREPLFCVVAVACAVTASGSQERPVRSDQQILIQLERDWDATFLRNDVRFVEKILADELVGCGDSTPPPSLDAAEPLREITATATLQPNGVSNPVDFVVPEATRSITIVVTGESAKLYALASLKTGDGVDRVNIDLTANYGRAMEKSYYIEQVGQMPGDLYQTIRLGTFTQVYPYAPGQTTPGGPAQLRVASNATSGQVSVTILMPEDDGGRVLHVNVLAVSDSFTISQPPSFLAVWQGIFDQAGLRIVVDNVGSITGTAFNEITQYSEPQEAPDSQSAQLALLGFQRVSPGALNIFVVDTLPTGIDGLGLGTPGPPLPSSYYYGVIVSHTTDDASQARVIAHEVSHFFGLQHVRNTSVSGMVSPDPIPDTRPGQNNLMEGGTVLTQGQAFALSRSALLKKE